MSDKGIPLYSPEWVAKYCSHIPEPYLACVLEICEALYLGNSYDPDVLWKILKKHLVKEETA